MIVLMMRDGAESTIHFREVFQSCVGHFNGSRRYTSPEAEIYYDIFIRVAPLTETFVLRKDGRLPFECLELSPTA